jgi:cobalt-zinc-cadmium efflux system outer membrane protein
MLFRVYNACECRNLPGLILAASILYGYCTAALFAQDPVPLPPVSQAPAQPGWTLAQLEEVAERNNPTLCQAAAMVDAARGRHLQAGLYPNPVVGYQASEINDEGRAGQQGGFVSQEFVTAGKRQLQQAVASQEVQQAESVWQAQRFRVLTDVRRAFYDVLVAQRSIQLAEQLVNVGRQGVQAAEQLVKAKEAARMDVLQAKIEADSAKILLEKAQNRHSASWRNLAAVIGDPAMPSTTLTGDLRDGTPELVWEATLNRVLAESPELAIAHAGVAKAQAVLSRECAGRIPNVDLQMGVQYDNATQDTIAGVQVGIPVPVFNRNQGNISKAQAELVAAQHEVVRVRLSLQQRLAMVFERYSTARQQVDRYTKEMLPNAQEALNLVASGYRQGEFGYIVLLTAQRTYFQTNLAYLESLRELREATTAIEGNLLFDNLQAERSVLNAN